MATVQGFRHALLREQREAAAAFRIIRAEDGSVRQMRAFAEPITDQAGTLVAVRGAYQDVSADYHTQVAFAATRDRLADTEERAEEEHRLALRLQQAITPQTAGRRPKRPGWMSPPGTARPGRAIWSAATGTTRCRCPADLSAGRRGHRRAWHRRGHRNGGAAQLPARPGHHRRGPGRPARLAEQRRLPPDRRHHRHRGVRPVPPGPPDAALGPGRAPAAACWSGTGWRANSRCPKASCSARTRIAATRKDHRAAARATRCCCSPTG